MTKLEALLAKLPDHKRSGRGYMARCPAHADGTGSLKIDEKADGTVLMHCHAGCSQDEVNKALGISAVSLVARPKKAKATAAKPEGLTVESFAAAKRMPIEALQNLGWTTVRFKKTTAIHIPYGSGYRARLRLGLTGEPKAIWASSGSRGSEPPMTAYDDPKAANLAHCGKERWFLEGESDHALCSYFGIPSLGIPGASMCKLIEPRHIDGLERAYYVREPDRGGDTFSEKLPARLRDLGYAGRLFEVTLPDAKDPVELHALDPAAFPARMKAARAAARAVPVENLKRLAELYPAVTSAPVPPGLLMPGDHGWRLLPSGKLERTVPRGKEVEQLVVSPTPLLLVATAEDDDGAKRLVITFLSRGKWQKRLVDRSALSSPAKAAETLMAAGAPVNLETGRHVARWLADLEHANQYVLEELRYVSRAGWYGADNDNAFVFGANAVTAKGPSNKFLLDEADERTRPLRAIRAHGDADTSRAAIMRAFEMSPVTAAMICSAFAAPMLRLLPAPSAAVHVYGRSSRGKTTSLRVAASVWGRNQPDEPDSIVTSFSATAVGMEQRAATMCDLPLFVDECHLMTDEAQRSALVYQLMGGMGKSRGRRDGGLRRTQTWRTVMVSTGEIPLVPDDTAVGGHARILQLQFDGLDSAAAVAALQDDCRANYGHLGPQFLHELLRTSPEQLSARYEAARRAARKKAGQSPLAARQADSVAVLAVAEGFCCELFGFGTATGETMLNLMAEGSAREEVESEHVRGLEALATWVTSSPSAFVRLIADSGDARRDSPLGGPRHLAPEEKREVFGFVGTEHVHFLVEPANRYLGERKLNAKVVMKGIRDDYTRDKALDHESNKLAKRVMIEGATHRVYSVKLSALYPPGTPEQKGEKPSEQGGVRVGGIHAN